MKYLIVEAKLCVNNKETWISFLPYSEFIKTDSCKGFNILSLKRRRIKGNVLKQLSMDWFYNPVSIYFKTINNIKEISKLKLGDKEIVSIS